MNATIKDGKLVIEIELLGAITQSKDGTLQAANLPSSSTGKTRVVASTYGNKPVGVMVNNQPLVVGVNAYIRA